MVTNEVRVALIGGGGFMGRAHSMAYGLIPGVTASEVRVVKQVLVDADAEVAAQAAARDGWLTSATGWEAIVTSDEIDVVDIVTPPQFHAAIARAAIAAGKPVFCEKPVANTLDDADSMAKLAEESGVVTQVGFNYRHTPAVTQLKRLIDGGELGDPLQLRGSYLQDGHYFLDDFGWRGRKATGGSGAVGDIGSHIIDLAQYLNGPIARVSARVRSNAGRARTRWVSEQTRLAGDLTDDAGLWVAEFANGSFGTFSVSFQAYGSKNRIRLELDATQGAVEFDWNRREEIRVALASDSATDSGFKTVFTSPAHEDVWYPVAGIGMGYLEGSAMQFARFLEAVTTGSPTSPTFAEAAQVQCVVEAIHRSSIDGDWIDVPTSTGVAA